MSHQRWATTPFLFSLVSHCAAAYLLFSHPNPMGLAPQLSNSISVNEKPTIIVEAIFEDAEAPAATAEAAAPSAADEDLPKVPRSVTREITSNQERTKDDARASTDSNNYAGPDGQKGTPLPKTSTVRKQGPLNEENDRALDKQIQAKGKADEHRQKTQEDKTSRKSEKIGKTKKTLINKNTDLSKKRKTPKKNKPHQKVKKQERARKVSSRGAKSRKGSSGRMSASRGDFLDYARRVKARVAANKPSGRGTRGRVSVSFGVTRSGGLAYVRLLRSSTSSTLDRTSLSAVRRAAPFSPPPAGMPSRSLSFSISFKFR